MTKLMPFFGENHLLGSLQTSKKIKNLPKAYEDLGEGIPRYMKLYYTWRSNYGVNKYTTQNQ